MIQPRFQSVAWVLLLMLGAVPGPTVAQVVSLYDVFYRPPGVRWMEAVDGAHTIIYSEGRELQARSSLQVLRNTKPGTNAFLGVTSDFRLDVVLTDQSDSGNGYVTPFPFKTEIEAVALRGRELSRRHHSWVEVVATHELVHAAQGAYRRPRSLTGLAGVFSPDFARALGLFQPAGFVEGLAVYRESQVPSDAGRLNHPFFRLQARAGMMERGGWTLSQALEEPSYTRPFDRFYKGGALFTEFLVDAYGVEAIDASLRWQQHIPFSGFGSNLRLAVDRSPKRLEQEFRAWFHAKEDSIRRSIGSVTPAETRWSRRGQTHRRPYWTEAGEIVTFALGYNLARGFQLVSADGSKHRLSRNAITDDAVFALSRDGSSILYSRYDEHPLTPRVKTSHVYRMDLQDGTEERIPGSEHTYNPVQLRDGRLLAIRSDGQFSRIVEIEPSGRQVDRLRMSSLEVVSMAPRLGSDSLAVIAKAGKHQAAFLVDASQEAWSLQPWIGFEASTIYDGAWDSTGRYYSFTSDRTGILNVYVLDAWREALVQATNVTYGAMEGHVSPDGARLVYVAYGEEQFDLLETRLDDSRVSLVNRELANATWTLDWLGDASRVESHARLDSVFANARPYRAWRHLNPRMVYPTAYLDDERSQAQDARLGFGVGAAMQGTDPLQRFAWYGEGFVQRNRLWGEFGVRSGRWPFRPGFNVERRPSTVAAVIRGQEGIHRVIRDRTNWSVSAFLPYTIEANAHRTSLNMTASLNYRSDRYLNDDLEVIQERRSRLAVAPGVFLGRRILRNPRDLWPTSGQSVSWFGDFELNRDEGEKRRGSVTLANLYIPLLRQTNTSIRLDVGHLYQSAAGVFGLRYIKPIGYEDAPVGGDSWIRTGLRIMQPIAFPDRGWLTLPVFVRALYLRTGIESIIRADDVDERYTTISGGIGLKVRFWHFFDVDFSWQAAYRIQAGDWDTVWTTLSENR